MVDHMVYTDYMYKMQLTLKVNLARNWIST